MTKNAPHLSCHLGHATWLSTWLAALFAVAPAAQADAQTDAQTDAQATARQLVLGKVTQLDGEPWAHATVRLIAWPYPGYWFVGTPDECTATTDARGRFEAALMPQRHYSAWAFAEADGGGYRLTNLVDEVVPASLVELRERADRQAPVRLRILQPDGAPPYGALSFRLISRAPTQTFVHELVLDENHEAPLPPMPSSLARLEAWTEDRVRVWTTSFYTTHSRRAAFAARAPQATDPVPALHVQAGESNERSIFTLPEPTTVRFTVKDSAGPVAGAEILIGAQVSAGSISDIHDCRVVARTDAAGVANVPMYLSFDADGVLTGSRPDVVVRSGSHFERMFRMMRDLREQGATLTRDAPNANVLLTGPSFTAKGRLLLAPGEPASGVPVLLYDAYSSGIGNSGSILTRPIVTTTDASGAFAFPGRVPDRAYRITALLPTDESSGREEVYLANPHDVQADGEHGTLVASRLVRADFQVLTPNGLPADRARIYLTEERNRPRTPITYLTDRSGRCSVRIPRDAQLCAVAASDHGFAAARLELPDTGARSSHDMQLAVGGVLTGVAVAKDGTPLSNVRVSILGGAEGRAWYADVLRDISLTTYALDYRGTYTDATGSFRAIFPLAGAKLSVSAWRRTTDGTYLRLVGDRQEVVLDENGNEPLRLVLDEWQRGG